MTHTPEPWIDQGDTITDAAGRHVAELDCDVFGHWDADRPRIVACVNALAGIPTDKLRPGIVRELIEAAQWGTEFPMQEAPMQKLAALLRELVSE